MKPAAITCICMLLFAWPATGQHCETFPRELFHMLSPEVPDTINCVDASGKRQGWWIEYKVDYNPKTIPDNVQKGYFVRDYVYGRYLNGDKTGTWKKIFNLHVVSESGQETYQYSGDTVKVSSGTMWFNEIYRYVELDRDTTFINFWEERVLWGEEGQILSKDTARINCMKKDDYCKIYFRGRLVETFPFYRYDILQDEVFTIIQYYQEARRSRHKKKRLF